MNTKLQNLPSSPLFGALMGAFFSVLLYKLIKDAPVFSLTAIALLAPLTFKRVRTFLHSRLMQGKVH